MPGHLAWAIPISDFSAPATRLTFIVLFKIIRQGSFAATSYILAAFGAGEHNGNSFAPNTIVVDSTISIPISIDSERLIPKFGIPPCTASEGEFSGLELYVIGLELAKLNPTNFVAQLDDVVSHVGLDTFINIKLNLK